MRAVTAKTVTGHFLSVDTQWTFLFLLKSMGFFLKKENKRALRISSTPKGLSLRQRAEKEEAPGHPVLALRDECGRTASPWVESSRP